MDASLQGDIIMLTRNVEILELWKKIYLEAHPRKDDHGKNYAVYEIVDFLSQFILEPEFDDVIRRLNPVLDFVVAVGKFKPEIWDALIGQITELFKDDEKVFWDLVELLSHFGRDLVRECTEKQLQDGLSTFCALMSAGITWSNYAIIWQTLEKGFTWDESEYCSASIENEKLFETVNRYFKKTLALKGVKAD